MEFMSELKYYNMRAKPIEEITIDDFGYDPPISYWAPRRVEIQRFVEIAKALHQSGDKPRILDVGCGNGFLAYLLAATEEVEVVGLDPDAKTIRRSKFRHPNLQLKVCDSTDAVHRY